MLKRISSSVFAINRRKMCERHYCALLENARIYQPDTLDLNGDTEAADYWFPLFRNMITKFSKQAAASQNDKDSTADDRANKFRLAFYELLEDFETKAKNNNNTKLEVLGIRKILELNELELRKYGFDDPWLQQKSHENDAATTLFEKRLEEIDDIEDQRQKWIELIRGVLAGNMFDWGAEAVASILINDQKFGLHAALDRIQKRPWLIDDLDKWLERVQNCDEPHKCAVIFVDNSGVDIILGILPFVRELLKQGTKVMLCANPEPTLNDVTFNELQLIVQKCSNHCKILSNALDEKNLLMYHNGQVGPCLDIRTLPKELCEAIQKNETDLLVIEGMGRALHTNLYAKFKCETLKLAVIKNKWLAQRLGGDTFSVICKYESINSTSTNSNSNNS